MTGTATRNFVSSVDRAQDRGWRSASFRLLWVVVFCIPWADMVLLPYGVQASRVVTLFAGLGWLLAVWRGKRFRTVTTTQLFMLLFLVWCGADVFWTENTSRSVRRMLSYCQLFLDVWLIYQLVSGYDEYRRLLQAYVMGAYVVIGGLAYNFLNGIAQGDGRYTAPGLDPNDLAATLAIGIPMAWYLAFTSRKTLWWCRLYVPCSVSAILLTASRAGLITLLASTAFPLLAMPTISRRAKVGLILLVGVCAGSIVFFWNDISVGRLSTIVDQVKNRDMNGRVEVWERGWDLFLENPILGVGGGAFSTVVGRRGAEMAAHNTFLGVLAEHGLIGFLFFGAVVVSLLRRAWSSPSLECRLWMVVLLAWGVAASTLSWENKEVTWLLWGICLAQPRRERVVRQSFSYSRKHVYA